MQQQNKSAFSYWKEWIMERDWCWIPVLLWYQPKCLCRIRRVLKAAPSVQILPESESCSVLKGFTPTRNTFCCVWEQSVYIRLYVHCTTTMWLRRKSISIHDTAASMHHSAHRVGIAVATTSLLSQTGCSISQLHRSCACGSEIALCASLTPPFTLRQWFTK